jgi:translation initiation factor 1
VRVSRQTKGRGGKSVTVIKGLALDSVALALLGKQLRTACGSGGTVKDGVIEVQGDHCELVMEALKTHGHNAKRAGNYISKRNARFQMRAATPDDLDVHPTDE